MADGEFQFTNERPMPAPGTLIVRVPTQLNRKRRVLAEYARQLQFPKYFGWNWDAWEECVRDLSWLEGIRHVAIVHRDLPFVDTTEQRAIYLSILRDLIARPAGEVPRFSVFFPLSSRRDVLQTLDQTNDD